MSSQPPTHAAPLSPSHYRRFRPSFHLQPPHGWVNDPCAPGFDARTGLYHLSFQWNPRSVEWAQISWGHCVSSDLVHWRARAGLEGDAEGGGEDGKWEDMRPVLVPQEPYDCEGIYTGCFVPSGPRGEKDLLSVVYTSVSHTSLHHTLGYIRGSESLSIATSSDRGRTWRRLPPGSGSGGNPILPGPPAHLSVKGWRDPFVSVWPGLARVLGEPAAAQRYGLLSGSVVGAGAGPNVFLYSVDSGDLTKWTFRAPLVHFPGLGLPSATAWTGDLGRNWEVGNFLPGLGPRTASHAAGTGTTPTERAYLTISAEGGSRWGRTESVRLAEAREAGRVPRWSLWFAGQLGVQGGDGEGGLPGLEYEFGGVLDHGYFYAANGFWDERSGRTITWGWILEDDLPFAQRVAQGWAGALSLPRELSVLRVARVARTLRTPLADIGCFALEQEKDADGWTVETLGIRPLRELELLRRAGREVGVPSLARSDATEDGGVGVAKSQRVWSLGTPGKCWEFEGTVDCAEGCGSVGMYVRHSTDMTQRTAIVFSPSDERLSVTHAMAPSAPVASLPSDSGPHTLFTFVDGTREKLALRVFCDNSVLEVFANDRFALTARMYPGEGADGASLFVDAAGKEEEGSQVVWENVRMWTGLAA